MRTFWATMIALFLLTTSALAAGDAAVVTRLDGKAQVFAKGDKKGKPIKRNDHIKKDEQVKVGEKSRIELRFPDGTVMRFAERSSIKMDDISYDGKTQDKKVRVDVENGKMWANVKKLVTPDSKVEVKTVNAVAGVRGTVYRVNVDDDKSAMVKVYDGSVYVDGKKQGTASGQSQPAGAPVQVAGPHEVPPPYHEVSLEEWHVIVKSFQQITISPQGDASKPQDFNPKQDQDDWVRWNQERDKQI
ncbi:MAG: FecR family protein [Nitrospiraceae bacterium]|nr:FecR family protein [Nitrospiraceae bacterium]